MPTHIYLKTNLYSGPITQHYLYGTWHGIKSRCFNKNQTSYKNYGGAGITIFQEWINDSAAFFIWIDETLGQKPEGYSLDRINSHGNYEPENLRWASASTQKKNIRNPEEWKRNLSKANKGKKLSEETKQKIGEGKIGEKNPMFGKKHLRLTCPHCGKECAVNRYPRLHGNNCPMNQENKPKE